MVEQTVEIKGLEELAKAFEQLPAKLARRGLRNATAKAARYIRDDMRARLPGSVNPGVSVEPKEIIVKTKPRTGRHKVTLQIGPSKKKFNYLFLELGAAPHAISRNGSSYQHPGFAPRPFMRPAFEQNKRKAIRIFGDAAAAFLEKEAKKAHK